MSTPEFAVSWIYEQMHACRLQNGKVISSWSAESDVRDLPEFNLALIEAAEAVGMTKGGDLALVYESKDQAHVFLELPPLKDRDLERMLERRAVQEKTFEGDAAWSYSNFSRSSDNGGVMFHIMPKNTRDAILRISEENHVAPMRLQPLTDVVAEIVAQQQFEPDKVILAAAFFPMHVALTVTNADGQALFERDLNFDWAADNFSRLVTDIERTLLYTKQRQQTVSQIVLLGPQADRCQAILASTTALPTQWLEESTSPTYWAQAVATQSEQPQSNLVPESWRQATRSKRLLRASAWLAAASVFCALAVSIGVEFLLWQQHKTDPTWQLRIADLTAQREQLLIEHERIAGLRSQFERLSPPETSVPARLLADLGELIPATAVLHKAEIELDDGTWNLGLIGATRPTMVDAVATIESISERLQAPPWGFSVSDAWRDLWLDKLRNGAAADAGLVGFELHGEIF